MNKKSYCRFMFHCLFQTGLSFGDGCIWELLPHSEQSQPCKTRGKEENIGCVVIAFSMGH